LQQHHQAIPGNKGKMVMPTATVVLASFAQVTLVSLELDGADVQQVHGWQEHHWLICQALGVNDSWYQSSANQKNNSMRHRAP
jgi:hypothetical protein